jgi:hypothetical protein
MKTKNLLKVDISSILEKQKDDIEELQSIMKEGSYWVKRDPNHNFLYKKVQHISGYQDKNKIIIDGLAKSVSEVLNEYKEGRWVEVEVIVKEK